VVEVDVGEHHVVHLLRGDALRRQRGQHPRRGARGAGVHDRRPPLLHDHVNGGLQAAVVDAVDDADAVLVIEDFSHSQIIEFEP
jgi:hypothetical protein